MGHVQREGVAAVRPTARRVPRPVPRAPAGAVPARARRGRRTYARPAASAAYC